MHVSPPLPHTLFPAVPPQMLPAKQTPKHGGAESVRGRRSRPLHYGKFLIKLFSLTRMCVWWCATSCPAGGARVMMRRLSQGDNLDPVM